MKIRSRALVALATTATLALGLAAPAQAASNVRDDARNDVVRGHASDDAQSVTAAPTVVQGDIRRFVVDHRAANVVITARFGDLARSSRIQQVSFLQLWTGTVGRNLAIHVVPGGSAQGMVELTNRADRPVRCDDLATRIDWSTNVIRMTVPRACLGNPRWVQAGYGYLRVNENQMVWADEAYRNRSVGDNLTFGPRVHRG